MPNQEFGMRILNERIDRQYSDGKAVKLFDVELLATGVALE